MPVGKYFSSVEFTVLALMETSQKSEFNRRLGIVMFVCILPSKQVWINNNNNNNNNIDDDNNNNNNIDDDKINNKQTDKRITENNKQQQNEEKRITSHRCG